MEVADSDNSEDDRILVSPQTNTYISAIKGKSGLILLEPERIKAAFSERGPYGLFSLFIPQESIERFRLATNESQQLTIPVTQTEMKTFFGLLLGMSFVRLRRIEDYWSTRLFLGQPDFRRFMSRNRFQSIRSALKICRSEDISPQQRNADPLWHFRPILTAFLKEMLCVCSSQVRFCSG